MKGHHSWTCPTGRMEDNPLLPPLPSAFPPQLLFSTSFASSRQALTHSLALGHLLLIGDQSQAHTYGAGREGSAALSPALHAACPTSACQCRLTAAIRMGEESLLSLLLPDPRVMKVGFLKAAR